MSISKKLKELAVAFGQDEDALKGNRIDSLIGALADYIDEHGSGGGGSDNDFKVTFTIDMTGESPRLTADKTIAEICAAADADKHVYAFIDLSTDEAHEHQRFELSQCKSGSVTFYAVQYDVNDGVESAKPVVVYGVEWPDDLGIEEWNVVD